MSSILKALKKLESEAPDRTEDAAPSLHRAMDVRRTLHDRFRKPRLLRRFSLALTVTLVLAVGAWAYLNRQAAPILKEDHSDREIARKRAEKPAPPPAAAPPAPASVVKAAPGLSRPQPRETGPGASPAETPPPEPAPMPTPLAKAPATKRIGPSEKPAPSAAALHDLAVQTPPADPEPETPPSIETRQSAAGQGPTAGAGDAAIDQRSDPRYHIQALVWSEAPEGRMAMVNGNIVKTGGAVGEARIVHIGENFIILEENGQKWRHPFRVQ